MYKLNYSSFSLIEGELTQNYSFSKSTDTPGTHMIKHTWVNDPAVAKGGGAHAGVSGCELRVLNLDKCCYHKK